MTVLAATSFDLPELLSSGQIVTHLQPIVSVRKHTIVGVEALSRGVQADGSLLAPLDLFAAAAEQGLHVELDRVCMRAALRAFPPLLRQQPDLILFLNCQPATVRDEPNLVLDLVRAAQLDPRHLAVEVLESEADNLPTWGRLVEEFKHAGMLVALDDVGSGHSNLDRIAAIRPDILKIDKSLIRDLHHSFAHQEIFRTLVTLSEKIGGWVVAEGIEDVRDAVAAVSLGADMLQGYHFGRPLPPGFAALPDCGPALADAAQRWRDQLLARIRARRQQQQKRLALVQLLAAELGQTDAAHYDRILAERIASLDGVESVHVLDERGIQITECVCNLPRSQRQKTIIFHAPTRGTDHSLKEYYYLLINEPVEHYTTNPYVPLPSGNLCVTITRRFHCHDGRLYILCLAIGHED